MFDKLHLLSQDAPEGGDGFRWRAHPYLRIAGSVPRGPAVFEWSARQRADLEALWRDPTSDGARERLAKDLAVFCERLGWTPDVKLLEDSEQHGEEYILTLSAVPPELYMLPWEVVRVGAEGRYLSDYASAQVRYAMPGLEARPMATAPDKPGVLFAWSRAGGEVPHEDQAAAIRAAAEAGGVAFQELADVDEVNLQAALDAGAPSVLHLLCHGLPGADGEPSRLSWGAADEPSEITATRLARMLQRYDGTLRLVVLSTCGSGDGYNNPMLLGSLAQELHKKGIRSVVASRYPLSVCGACVMTRTLYDKMLREAWSLERALRYTREVLLRVADHGETHPGDAYGIQLYAYDTERFVSDNAVEAERPVLATYPFGTAARPVPAKAPPSTELALVMEAEPKLSEEELVAKLRRVTEDDQLTVAIPLGDGEGRTLSVHTTADGAQRLMGAWRSRVLHVAIGVAVGRLLLAKGVAGGLQSLLSALASKVGAAAGHLGAVADSGAAGKVVVTGGKIGVAAGRAAKVTSQVTGKAVVTGGKIGVAAGRAAKVTSQVTGKVGGTVGQAGAAGQVVVGQAGAAGQAVAGQAVAGQVVGQAAVASQVAVTGGAGKIAAAVAIAGKVASTKVAVMAVLSTVAVVGGAEVYRAEKTRSAAAPVAPAQSSASPSRVVPSAKVVDGLTDPAPVVAMAAPALPSEPATQAPPVAPPAMVAPPGPPAPVTASPSQVTQARLAAAPPAAADPPAAPSAPPETPEAVAATALAEPAPAPAAALAPPSSAASASSGSAAPADQVAGVDGSRSAAGEAAAALSAAPATSATPPAALPAASATPPAALPAESAPPPAAPPAASATTPAAPPAASATTPAAPVCGNGVKEAGEQCDDGNTRDGDGCSAKCTLDPVAITPSALALQRVSGNTDVDPGKQTRSAMIRDGVTSVKATVRLCVDPVGSVTESMLIEPTRYAEYNQKLIAAVRNWRFRPYVVNGQAFAVCSTADFVHVPAR